MTDLKWPSKITNLTLLRWPTEVKWPKMLHNLLLNSAVSLDRSPALLAPLALLTLKVLLTATWKVNGWMRHLSLLQLLGWECLIKPSMFYLVKNTCWIFKVFILVPFQLKATGKRETQVPTILLPWFNPRYFVSFEAKILSTMLTIFWHQIQTVNLATYISSG